MAAPSTTGGLTVLETCDTGGSSGKAPSSPHASSTFTAASTLSTGFAIGVNQTGCGRISNGSTTASYLGGRYPVTSTDFSVANRLLVAHVTIPSGIDPISTSKSIFVYANSSSLGTEEAVFSVAGSESFTSSFVSAVINISKTTNAYVHTGTFDATDVTDIGAGYYPTSGFQNLYVDTLGYFDPIIAINGESGNKGNINTLIDAIDGLDAALNESPTNNLHHLLFHWGVGDGSTLTHFSETLKSFEFARDFDTATFWGRVHINDNDFGFECNASASDVIDFELCNWLSDTPFYWNSIGSTSATVSYISCVVQNAGELTIVDGHTFDGCLFDSCGKIVANNPTLTNTTIKNSATAALELDSGAGANLTGVIFSGNQTDILVDQVGSGTLDVTECTFNTSSTYYIEYTGTGTLTVTASGTIAAGKLNASGGGTITVVAPSTDVTINSNIAASDLKIFDGSASQTILASATDTTVAYTYSGTKTFYYTVQKAGYVPQRGSISGTDESLTVNVTLKVDPVYTSSHGLTYTTDYAYNANTRVLTLVAAEEGRNVYSSLVEQFISNSSFYNREFPLAAIGPDRIDFTSDGTTAATIDSGDIAFWRGAGMEWEHATTGNKTHKFCSVKGVGTNAAGTKGYYQYAAGSGTTALSLVSNNVDQVIQYYSDPNGDGSVADGYDRSSHLVIKLFNQGYYQARADILTSFGISALESFEYTVNLLTTPFDFSSGDQAITIATLTDHTGAPIDPASSGNAFSFELVDPGTNTAAQLAAQLNYDIFTDPTATIYTSYTAFNLPDIIIGSGGSYETEEGFVESESDALGFYVSRSSADHPSITRFEDDNGTYYTPAVTANITITGMPTAGGSIRLQIHNETAKTASAWQATTAYSLGDKVLRSTGLGSEQTAGLYMVCTTAGTTGGTEPTWATTVNNTTADGSLTWTTYAILYYDADPVSSGYSDSYTDLEQFASGDTYRIRFAELNGTTSFKTYETTGLTTSVGFTVSVSVTADDVYATNAVDGSSATVTNKFSPDYSNNEIDLDTNTDFAVTEAYAYYCYELTTSDGMYTAWGAVTGIDAANYRNNASIFSLYFDETAGFVKQTDSARWFRDDGARPVRDPTTGGSGIELNWRNPVYLVETGVSGLTGTESAQLSEISTVNTKIDTIDTNVDAILVDTGTTIPAQISGLNDFDPASDVVARVTLCDTVTANTDMRGTDGANTTAPDNSSITAIKAKTDQLTFTKANELDSNIQSVNDVTVSGTGASGDEWGP